MAEHDKLIVRFTDRSVHRLLQHSSELATLLNFSPRPYSLFLELGRSSTRHEITKWRLI